MKRKLKIVGIVLGVLVTVLVGLFFLLYRDIPYFKKLQKPRIAKFSKDNVRISADIICFNPNHLSIRLEDCAFDVYANGKKVADVKQHFTTTVGANSDFKIPLNVSFSPLKLFKAKDLLGAAFNSLKSKRIDLRFDGTVTVGVAGQDVDIAVDVEDWVSLEKPQ